MHLYHPIAALTREFLAIEGQGFDMIWFYLVTEGFP
jgi:hypothetical protein